MGLSRKTFLYSILIAALMVAFVIGYFVLMLPSLYVDYVMKSNLKNVIELQKGYMETRSYDTLAVKNPSAAFSLEIPDTGTCLYAAGKFFKLTIEIQDDELYALLNTIRTQITGTEKTEETLRKNTWEDIPALWEILERKFAASNFPAQDSPISIQMNQTGSQDTVYREEYDKFHVISDGFFVYETGVSDGNYSYTTYTAIAHAQGACIITFLPTMTPRMDEITPIVMNSLPMITAVVFLLILISSRFFSGKIVNPVIRLAAYAESARLADFPEASVAEKETPDTGRRTFLKKENKPDSKDEILALDRAIHELYEKLHANYLELEEKNHELNEENIRQEAFLRASSHQLKTPVSAALLLVEGMMNEIGKYKNTKEYLPQVKNQLLSMKKMIEDILYLNYHAENTEKENVILEPLIQELIHAYSVQIDAKNLSVSIKGNSAILSDKTILKQILGNLLSNAVEYTPKEEKIEIELSTQELSMKNYGITIDEKILPNIFEPFVSSDETKKGKGLGLYVASYYSRLAGYKIKIENMENGVCARIIFS